MRLRSVVLAAVSVAAVAVPGSAASAAVPGCHLNGPTKVVVNAATEAVTWGFGADCMDVTNGGGASASWELRSPSGALVKTIGLEIPDPLAYEDTHTFADTAPMGRYTTDALGITPSWLTQNQPVIDVKYHSRITAPVTRTSTALTWAATATQWSGRSHAYVPRPGVRVGVFHQPTSASAWTFQKSVYTSSTGKAAVSVTSPKTGNYRLVIGETPTVWAAYSPAVKGRV